MLIAKLANINIRNDQCLDIGNCQDILMLISDHNWVDFLTVQIFNGT